MRIGCDSSFSFHTFHTGQRPRRRRDNLTHIQIRKFIRGGRRRPTPAKGKITKFSLRGQIESPFDLPAHGRNAVLDIRHGRYQRHHRRAAARIEPLVGTDARHLAHRTHVARRVVLLGGSIACDHAPHRIEPVAAAVGIQQHEHGAVAPLHRLELLEVGIARGVHLAAVAYARAAYVSRVAIIHTAAHRSPPFFFISRPTKRLSHRSARASLMRQAFSRNDHSSTPHTKPAKSRVRSGAKNPAVTASIMHAMPRAMITNPSFCAVRHASRLSKRHARPSRRASTREAATPVTKSTPMKSVTHHTSGGSGASSAANDTAQPLKNLYKASIRTTSFEYVCTRIVFGYRRRVLVQILRQAQQHSVRLHLERPHQLDARRLGRRRGKEPRRLGKPRLTRTHVEPRLNLQPRTCRGRGRQMGFQIGIAPRRHGRAYGRPRHRLHPAAHRRRDIPLADGFGRDISPVRKCQPYHLGRRYDHVIHNYTHFKAAVRPARRPPHAARFNLSWSRCIWLSPTGRPAGARPPDRSPDRRPCAPPKPSCRSVWSVSAGG
nr:MAG TPA: hypothetical protein [Caudoviricetes sp.]